MKDVASTYQMGLVALPISLGGTWLGLTLGARIPRNAVRRLVCARLLLAALRAIVAPYFQIGFFRGLVASIFGFGLLGGPCDTP